LNISGGDNISHIKGSQTLNSVGLVNNDGRGDNNNINFGNINELRSYSNNHININNNNNNLIYNNAGNGTKLTRKAYEKDNKDITEDPDPLITNNIIIKNNNNNGNNNNNNNRIEYPPTHPRYPYDNGYIPMSILSHSHTIYYTPTTT